MVRAPPLVTQISPRTPKRSFPETTSLNPVALFSALSVVPAQTGVGVMVGEEVRDGDGVGVQAASCTFPESPKTTIHFASLNGMNTLNRQATTSSASASSDLCPKSFSFCIMGSERSLGGYQWSPTRSWVRLRRPCLQGHLRARAGHLYCWHHPG